MLTSNNFMSMISIAVMPVFPAMKKTNTFYPKSKCTRFENVFFFFFRS